LTFPHTLVDRIPGELSLIVEKYSFIKQVIAGLYLMSKSYIASFDNDVE